MGNMKVNKYADTSEIKFLCGQRKLASCVVVKASLTRSIHNLRKEARKQHKNNLCKLVGEMKWQHTQELLREIDRDKPKTTMKAMQDEKGNKYGIEKIDQWGKVVQDFWGEVFQDTQENVATIWQFVHYLCMQVTALTMALILDGTFFDLISMQVLNNAILGMKPNKAIDEQGMVAEALLYLSEASKEHLLTLFNKRAQDTDISKLEEQDMWWDCLAHMFPKFPGNTEVGNFRPIHIIYTLQKCYHRCLLLLIQTFAHFEGLIQFGGRKSYQVAELVMLLRLVVEKCCEWRFGFVIIALDLKKAFDSVSMVGLVDYFKGATHIPLRIRFAILKELVGARRVKFVMQSTRTDWVNMISGFRQGSPESTFLFAQIVNEELQKIQVKWRSKGAGLRFRKWGGSPYAFAEWLELHKEHVEGWNPEDIWLSVLAYLDDVYLIAGTMAQAQDMLNDVTLALKRIGLLLQTSKVKYMTDKHGIANPEHVALKVGELEIKEVTSMIVLGSVITHDGAEKETYEHRIKRAWACYWKWQAVLEGSASLPHRLKFWCATVLKSLTWCLATTRHDEHLSQRLAVTQRLMVRKMLKIKRRPMSNSSATREPWLDWQRRSLRQAGHIVMQHNMGVGNCLFDSRNSWAGHVGRFGCGGRPIHLVKQLFIWRNLAWWRFQQMYNDLGLNEVRHPPRIGRIRRYEESLSQDWLQTQP